MRPSHEQWLLSSIFLPFGCCSGQAQLWTHVLREVCFMWMPQCCSTASAHHLQKHSWVTDHTTAQLCCHDLDGHGAERSSEA